MITHRVLTEEPVKMWTLVSLSAAVPLVLKGKDARPSHVGVDSFKQHTILYPKHDQCLDISAVSL